METESLQSEETKKENKLEEKSMEQLLATVGNSQTLEIAKEISPSKSYSRNDVPLYDLENTQDQSRKLPVVR